MTGTVADPPSLLGSPHQDELQWVMLVFIDISQRAQFYNAKVLRFIEDECRACCYSSIKNPETVFWAQPMITL